MSERSFKTCPSYASHHTAVTPQAGPDTVNHIVLALNVVSLVAVAMMTLQHIAVVLHHKVLCEQGTRRGDRGGRDSGRRKRGQLLLKDEPRSQSCLCHMTLGAQLSGRFPRGGRILGERDGKQRSVRPEENRWGSVKGKWREMRNVKMGSQWSSSALRWNKNLLFRHPAPTSDSSSFIPDSAHLVFPSRYQTPTPVSHQLALIAPTWLPSLFL